MDKPENEEHSRKIYARLSHLLARRKIFYQTIGTDPEDLYRRFVGLKLVRPETLHLDHLRGFCPLPPDIDLVEMIAAKKTELGLSFRTSDAVDAYRQFQNMTFMPTLPEGWVNASTFAAEHKFRVRTLQSRLLRYRLMLPETPERIFRECGWGYYGDADKPVILAERSFLEGLTRALPDPASDPVLSGTLLPVRKPDPGKTGAVTQRYEVEGKTYILKFGRQPKSLADLGRRYVGATSAIAGRIIRFYIDSITTRGVYFQTDRTPEGDIVLTLLSRGEDAMVVKRLLLPRKNIVPEPEGWHDLGALRDLYTDSQQTMRRIIAKALAVADQEGLDRTTLVTTAHNARRLLVEYYSPAFVALIDRHKLATRLSHRQAFSEKPAGWIHFDDLRTHVGGGSLKSMSEQVTSWLLQQPEDYRRAQSGDYRLPNGKICFCFSPEALGRMQAANLFAAQKTYQNMPVKPNGWLGSKELSQTYLMNKAGAIRLMTAFSQAVTEIPGANPEALVGTYRHNGKIGIFISPDGLELINSGQIQGLRKPAPRPSCC